MSGSDGSNPKASVRNVPPPPRREKTAAAAEGEEGRRFVATGDGALVAVRVPHAHKYRATLWMADKFPGAKLRWNGKDLLVFGAGDGGAVVERFRDDASARRFVHAVTACRPAVHAGRAALEAALVAARAGAAGSAKLVVYGERGLKASLLRSLPASVVLAPRGHAACVAVEAVGGGAYLLGECGAAEEFAGDARVVEAKRARPDAVCRAFFKLKECLEGDAALGAALAGGRVVDVGASPGGWSQVCLEAGAAAVYAVDPGAIDAGLLERSAGRLVHVRSRVEDAADALDAGGPFDAVVCDANCHPNAALRALASTAAWNPNRFKIPST